MNNMRLGIVVYAAKPHLLIPPTADKEALKYYDYSWAKLNLTTEGEDFLLRLQFDGKPARLLPFVYKKEIGGFARVEVGSVGSQFQGIRLDVNFRLPLNEVLRYKDIFNMMQ